MAIYKGFSTANWLENKSLIISDIEAIKHDLQNHIFTRLGERVMQPGFGTRIPEMAFEPNDEATIKIIRDDVLTVINYDPRVELVSLEVLPIPDNNTIIVLVTVLYIEFEVQGELRIDVKNRTLT
jgi:phage baseplate assembly protein W